MVEQFQTTIGARIWCLSLYSVMEEFGEYLLRWGNTYQYITNGTRHENFPILEEEDEGDKPLTPMDIAWCYEFGNDTSSIEKEFGFKRFENFKDVEQNYEKAIEIYEGEVKEGNPEAAKRLAKIYNLEYRDCKKVNIGINALQIWEMRNLKED